MSKKREVEIVVLSDVHLGTRGCRAKELYKYLKTIKPEILVLNGDIVDFWQFSKRYWPNSHMKVIKQIITLASKGTKTYYITGNHDETLRKFAGMKIGNLKVVNKLVLDVDGINVWFFHGDVFDVIMQYSKWIAKIGAMGYDGLIILNNFINTICRFFGRERVSLSKKIKDNIKSAVKYINKFEETAACVAQRKGYDCIVCGHIHQPDIREIDINGKPIKYLNAGDWIENLTALEYNKKQWSLFFYYDEKNKIDTLAEDEKQKLIEDYNNKQLFQFMLDDFNS